MDNEEVDLEALAAPVEDGVGPDPRLGGPAGALYLGLKDARGDARDAERQAMVAQDAETTVLEAGLRWWRRVAEFAVELLAGHAKDLEVAGWLTEAWLREDGFAGLARGLDLMSVLVERFWNAGLWPAAEEGEAAEDRLAPLFGLLGRDGVSALLQPVRMLPLASSGGIGVALWDLELAQQPAPRAEDADSRERLQALRAERIEALEQVIRRTAPAALRSTHRAASEAQAALARLIDTVDAATGVGRFGSQLAAPLIAVREALETRVGSLLGPEADGGAQAALDDASLASTGPGPAAASSSSSSPARDRAGAFAAVLEAAEFFDRSEPQSLVGRSLREVVRRAQLPLDDLLAELLPERELRTAFLLRAGVRTAPSVEDNLY